MGEAMNNEAAAIAQGNADASILRVIRYKIHAVENWINSNAA
jgi:hypothetical protein